MKSDPTRSNKVDVTLTVNGIEYERTVEPRYLLVDFLRHELGLTGTHIGCEQGVCGACTVLLDGETARSCLHFAVQVSGAEITTIEGVAADAGLSPIQDAFHRNHALQCGYCTPGFVLTTVELLRENSTPDEAEIRLGLTNNICRCTGYVNIIKAVAEAAGNMSGEVG